MSEVYFVAACVAAVFVLAMTRGRLWMWAVVSGLAVFIWQSGLLAGVMTLPTLSAATLVWWLPTAVFALLAVPSVRRGLVVAPIFSMIRKILPKVSETEQEALNAGTVGFDAELFSGQPDWQKLRNIPGIALTEEERAFLDGPTVELCRMIDDWHIRHNEREIPDEIWKFVSDHGFLGMLISKEHGGLGFSAQAQSLILGKIASRSPDVVTIVMVPNSLGPGELIEKYGTAHQKDYYLPRLAKGLEVPCFALTGPTSGSDAATMRDVGTVVRQTFEGKETLGIKLSWEKRYITLGPRATLLGLAFYLFDPENLLGKGQELGITLAIIPATHEGVNIGRRHLPSGAAFPNGPNWGSDVFIPIDWVIGGEEKVGTGWRMLMECLSAGRSISLPSSSAAGIKSMLRSSTAYGRVRRQFGLSIARMQGLEEPLARIAEQAYVVEAARATTAAIVAAGEKPSVISAIMKYQATERMRGAVNDAMDLHGGRGICDGPANYLQSAYQMVPVGITVEGANILTRTLITFAQGALRSHPYLYSEVQAAQMEDRSHGLAAFEHAFCNHVGFAVSNIFGALFHNLTGGVFARSAPNAGRVARWYKQVSRASRNFALVADMTVAVLGGGLKIKQKLTGRLADALSELYLLSCTLKRFEDDGRSDDELAIVELAARNSLYRFQQALSGAIDNFPSLPVRIMLRWLVFPVGHHYRPASDDLGHKVVRQIIEPGAFRDKLTREIYVSRDPNDATGILEVALEKVVASEAAERKLEKAIREGHVRRFHGLDWIGDAQSKSILTADEAELLREVEALTAKVIAVDDFDPDEVRPNYAGLGHNSRAAQQHSTAAQ